MNDVSQIASLRNQRKPCHFWVDNEVVDNYQAIVGADAVWVYCRIARYAHGAWIVSPRLRGAADTRVGLREMAEWCGKSVDTVWRCLEVLKHVGLIQSEGVAAKSRGRYALADVKELVMREGAEYDPATGSMRLPALRVAELRTQVQELRVRLARKTARRSGLAALQSAKPSVAQSDRLNGSLFSAAAGECDRSVAPDAQICRSGATDNFLYEESKTAKQEYSPQPPFADANGGEWLENQLPAGEDAKPLSPGEEIDAAVDRVMRHIVANARRLRRKLRAVMVQRMEMGELPLDVAAKMCKSWDTYTAQGTMLFKHMSAAEFFEGPYWHNQGAWNWDNREIREARIQAESRVGSWRG